MIKPSLSRLRRTLKWAGLGMCIFVLLPGALSLKCPMTYHWPGTVTVLVSRGGVAIWWNNSGLTYEPGFSIKSGKRGFIDALVSRFDGPPLVLSSRSGVAIELWLVLAVLCPVTSLLFWRDRRRRIPPGHCQKCGYNLTGNVSGKCSECGEPIPKEIQEESNRRHQESCKR